MGAPDLRAVTDVARSLGITVALVEQPYVVAGRRSPAPAPRLDAAWKAVVAQLREEALRGLPLMLGGRSAGARVACRTAAELGVVAVLCLAFPLHPPGRGGDPSASRLALTTTGDRPDCANVVVERRDSANGTPARRRKFL